MSSVVTVSLFSRLVSVTRCFHENSLWLVWFLCFPMCTKCHCMASISYSLAVGLVGQQVVCVHGAYCRAYEVVT